ncbi:MAG: hypothetical protein KatS3mg038_1802 [Candidatus Kapaibacterium sp.]|nr:MAG: hypothetical protein KatS3mg038_1802 [Candidatus Kapabacteria bacterium]
MSTDPAFEKLLEIQEHCEDLLEQVDDIRDQLLEIANIWQQAWLHRVRARIEDASMLLHYAKFNLDEQLNSDQDAVDRDDFYHDEQSHSE